MPKGNITPHFTWEEARCKDGTAVPYGLEGNARAVAALLEVIRERLGDRAITVHSWYRTPKYNAKVGGKPNSMHLKAGAADITVRDMAPSEVQTAVLVLRDELRQKGGPIQIGGIGRYSTFTHVDIGEYRNWYPVSEDTPGDVG